MMYKKLFDYYECAVGSQQIPKTTLQEAPWFGVLPDKWIQHVISIHFDPIDGARYWIQKEKDLGINARRDISSLDDLRIFGPFEEEDLRRYPVEYFIPKIFLRSKKNELILGETAGTTGLPKVTAYMKEEFNAVFVEWFRYIAEYRKFPRGVNWLWVGPGGPHIIGKAAGPVANSMGSIDPFSIDMDPRWVKKLKPDSIAYRRYIDHITEQALDIIRRQNIGVIYTTPPLLVRLAEKMTALQRSSIRGIHYGGVTVDKDLLKRFKNEYFTEAVHIAGYGNTLFGLCMEIEASPDYDLDYFPPGPRMVLQVVSTENGVFRDAYRLNRVVDYGERGQVVCHRIDESFFIPNMFERDEAIRIAATRTVQSLGVFQDGIRNPSILRGMETSIKTGVY